MGKVNAPRVAYLTQAFPLFSLTFMVDEIESMRAMGVQLSLFSVRRPADDDYPPIFQRYRDECVYVLPVRPLKHVLSHLAWLVTQPRRYLSCWAYVAKAPGCGWRERLKLAVYLCEAVALAGTLRPAQFDHLHVHFLFGATLVAIFLKRLTGLPYSATGHGSDFLVEHWLLPDKVGEAEFVRIGTRFNASFLRGLLPPAQEGKLFVLPFGIDARAQVGGPEAVAAQIAARANPCVKIINVGRLVWQKGQDTLLDAAALLADRGLPFELEIIGEGELRAALQDQATRLGLQQRVTFRGALPREDVLAAMRQADVFAFPSVSEGFGIVLLEAMACGLAIVANDIMGVTEIVSDGENGLIDREKTAASLADKLEALVTDTPLRQRLQRAALQSALKDFDHHEKVARLKERMFAGSAGTA